MSMQSKLGRIAPAHLLAALALSLSGGCEASAAPAVHTIVVDEMKFTPAARKIRAGDTILWVNNGVLRHSATARDDSFNVDLPPRSSRRTVIPRAGSIAYYCIYHPAMKGTLNVAK